MSQLILWDVHFHHFLTLYCLKDKALGILIDNEHNH